MSERRLLRKLGVVILLKLFLLTGLWWMFIRDERVPVDAERAAHAIIGDSSATMVKQGEQHGH